MQDSALCTRFLFACQCAAATFRIWRCSCQQCCGGCCDSSSAGSRCFRCSGNNKCRWYCCSRCQRRVRDFEGSCRCRTRLSPNSVWASSPSFVFAWPSFQTVHLRNNETCCHEPSTLGIAPRSPLAPLLSTTCRWPSSMRPCQSDHIQ